MCDQDGFDDQQKLLIAAMLSSARSVIREDPYVGRQRAAKRARSGRLGIWLSRQPFVRRLEQQGIRVDIEYDQMADGVAKVVGRSQRRIDVLLHKRGIAGPNLLACEVKPNDRRPASFDSTDLDKLVHLTMQEGHFRYRIGMWVSLPRSVGGLGYYAIVGDGRLLRGATGTAICVLSA